MESPQKGGKKIGKPLQKFKWKLKTMT